MAESTNIGVLVLRMIDEEADQMQAKVTVTGDDGVEMVAEIELNLIAVTVNGERVVL